MCVEIHFDAKVSPNPHLSLIGSILVGASTVTLDAIVNAIVEGDFGEHPARDIATDATVSPGAPTLAAFGSVWAPPQAQAPPR